MSITGYTVFRFHRVVELHFTTDHYNLFKHEGRVRGATEDDFIKHPHKKFYNRFSSNFKNRDELLDYFVANFAYRSKKGFIFNKKSNSFSFRDEWVRRKENITEVFKEDIQKISKTYQEMNGSMDPDTKNPILLELFFEKEITIETLRIIEDIHPYLHQWERDEDIKEACNDIIRIIKKLEKLVKYDSEKIKEIWNTFMENVDLTK